MSKEEAIEKGRSVVAGSLGARARALKAEDASSALPSPHTGIREEWLTGWPLVPG